VTDAALARSYRPAKPRRANLFRVFKDSRWCGRRIWDRRRIGL